LDAIRVDSAAVTIVLESGARMALRGRWKPGGTSSL